MDKKEIIDYFRNNIFEAYAAYTLWKVIAYSKSTGVVDKNMADRYVEIQNYHGEFFSITERATVIAFVILILHPFDKDSRAYSFYEINDEETKDFVIDNKEVLDELFLVRNKVFAHRDKDVTKSTLNDYPLPSVERLDTFFESLIKFYNQLCVIVDGSTTLFSNAENIKNDTEHLFMNLYRGENIRKKEIDIEWLWENDNKKISDII